METLHNAGNWGIVIIASGGLCAVLTFVLFILRIFMEKLRHGEVRKLTY